MNVTTNNTQLINFQIKGYNGDATTAAEALRLAGTGLQITNVQVNACRAPQSPTYFYPIEIVAGATVIFNGGGVTCNTYSEGGGIHLTGSATNVTLKNYQIIGNSDGANGVALWIDGSGTVNCYNSRFEYNNGASDEVGSAIYQTGGAVKVYDSYFNANTVNVPGNAVGGAISIAGGTFLVTHSTFKNNVYSGGNGIYGCGIGVTAGTVTIDSCYFSGNLGSRSNDVYVKAGTVIAYNCTFASASNQLGMAGGSFTISNSGNPGKYGSGFAMTNITAPSYTPAPILPNYLSQSCQSISCTTPATPTTIYGSQTQCPSLTSQTYSVTAVSGATTYNWTVPTGWTITSGQNTNAITVKTGTSGQNGTINVQAANYCGQGGTQSLAVTINPGTPATPTAITGAASVCPNLTGTTYSITPVANASTYSWTLPSGWRITSPSASSNTLSTTATTITVKDSTNAQSGNITVTATNGCGTSNASAKALTVNPQPAFNLGANKSICLGSSITIGDVPTSGYTCAWSPSVNLSNPATSSVQANPLTTTTYTLTETNAYECSQSASTTIVVNPLPNITATSTRVCPGNQVQLNGSGATSYLWTGGVSNGVPFVPQVTTTYTVTGTDNNGCQNTSTITVYALNNTAGTASINVTPAVTVANGSPNTIYISHGVQTLGLTATVDCSIQTYSWSGGADLSCTNCLTTTVSPRVTTTYQFTYVNATGQTISQPVTIYVVDLGNLCNQCK